MLFYVLIGLSLSLAGVAGLQFVYLFYLDRIDKERKRRLHELELRCIKLSHRLNEAEEKLAEQKDMIAALDLSSDFDEEVWADVIEDK